MWLLGNLFRTEDEALWKFLEIAADAMVSDTENYGILPYALF